MKNSMPHPVPRVFLRRGTLALVWLAIPALAVDYEKEIKPLLKERCYACHGALKQKADLRLDTAAAMRKGGDGGDILAGDSALLLERVTTTDKHDRMPPEGEGSMLNTEQVAKFKAWLAAGAPIPVRTGPTRCLNHPASRWMRCSPHVSLRRSSSRSPKPRRNCG
jgi:mono/diheme cytochrome c family protein